MLATEPVPVTDNPTSMAAGFVSSLEPSFRAQEMSYGIAAIARNIELILAARRRNWWQRLLGRRPGDVQPLTSAQQRVAAHIGRHSVWLHNSLRGAIGLGLAVLVADLTGVQHGFWVVFGTLSVLRSSALITGQDVLRSLLGTVIGFVIGAGLLAALGTNATVLWCLLPIVVLLAGIAPAAISFAAGQAAFTLTVVILFNIIDPVGWRVGLVRIEDVAIGCAVSLAVGVLFWPRGAGVASSRALADAYTESATYLRSVGPSGWRAVTSACRRSPHRGSEDDSGCSGRAQIGRRVPQLACRARFEAATPRPGDEPGDRSRGGSPGGRCGARPLAIGRRSGGWRPGGGAA